MGSVSDRLRLIVQTQYNGVSAAFADDLRVERTQVSQWLADRHQPRAPTLQIIAERTGVCLNWLLLGEGGEEVVLRGTTRSPARLHIDVAAVLSRNVSRRLAAIHGMDTRGAKVVVDVVKVLQDATEEGAQAIAKHADAYKNLQTIAATIRAVSRDLVELSGAIVFEADDSDRYEMAAALAERLERLAELATLAKPAIHGGAYSLEFDVPRPPFRASALVDVMNRIATADGVAADDRQRDFAEFLAALDRVEQQWFAARTAPEIGYDSATPKQSE